MRSTRTPLVRSIISFFVQLFLCILFELLHLQMTRYFQLATVILGQLLQPLAPLLFHMKWLASLFSIWSKHLKSLLYPLFQVILLFSRDVLFPLIKNMAFPFKIVYSLWGWCELANTFWLLKTIASELISNFWENFTIIVDHMSSFFTPYHHLIQRIITTIISNLTPRKLVPGIFHALLSLMKWSLDFLPQWQLKIIRGLSAKIFGRGKQESHVTARNEEALVTIAIFTFGVYFNIFFLGYLSKLFLWNIDRYYFSTNVAFPESFFRPDFEHHIHGITMFGLTIALFIITRLVVFLFRKLLHLIFSVHRYHNQHNRNFLKKTK